jgi:hypothetical protein
VREANLLREDEVAAVGGVAQPGGGGQGELRQFREQIYDCLIDRADALFDLVDGICSPVRVDGVAHVTLAPGARRGHGAAYAGLSAGRVDEQMLRDVLACHRPRHWRPDFAVDATIWARCDAECSPGRGFYYHPTRHSAGQPIVAGWCYSWLVALSPGADSWTAPLDACRMVVGENVNTVAVRQVRQLLPRPQRNTVMTGQSTAGFRASTTRIGTPASWPKHTRPGPDARGDQSPCPRPATQH